MSGPAEDRLAGVLMGTGLGDALGLPAEGMSPRAIARRFGRVDRFRLLGRVGFVSDDTEQSALIAQSLCREPTDPERCALAFRNALLGWFLRLPFGVGLGTVRACLKIALGVRNSGVRSAGNGAAMRAAVVGVAFAEDAARREAFGRALAVVTHVDPRAVAGALFVAELAAACSRGDASSDRLALVLEARETVSEPDLAKRLDRAVALAREGASLELASRELGTSGFVLHTVPFACWVFLTRTGDVTGAIAEAIAVGGDTDSIAAILGAWLGALVGEAGLPPDLIGRIHDGPFGPSHLRALAAALARARDGDRPVAAPRYSAAAAMARNLGLMPVILGHGLRRLLPF